MGNLNINKSIIGGNLTADPELKQTQNGIPVTSFTVAVRRRTSKGKEPITDFLTVVAWRQTAEFVCKYFHKGSSICVVGSNQTRTWKDNAGNNRYATEIVADEVYFVDSKSNNEPNSAPYIPDSYTAPQFEDITDEDELPF